MFKRISAQGAAMAIAAGLVFGSCSPSGPAEDAQVAPTSSSTRPAATGPPNVVWILADTLRADSLSVYGYERPTSPVMEALGKRGAVFENHFSQGLWTLISVPSILTGRYFPINVVENFDYRVINRYLPSDQQTAPQLFKANGYKTAMFTAHRHLVSETSRFGRAFDDTYSVLNASGQKPHGNFADVNDAFFAWHEGQDGGPFFAYLHLMDNHFPHMPTGKYAQWLRDDITPGVFGASGPVDTDQQFAEADIAHMAGLYDGDVLFVDDQLARLQQYLKRKGLLENTIILITSDHGDLLGEDGTSWGHDSFSHDQIMHVPWIMAGPGIPEGVRFAGKTENVDILPTLLDVLGIEGAGSFDGRSMASGLDGDPDRPREYTFARNPNQRHYDYPTSFILRTDAVKYEFDPVTGEERMWRVPDDAGAREDVLDANRALADELRGILERDFVPRFEAFMGTEIEWILGRVGGGQAENWRPAEAVRVLDRHEHAEGLATDNLWASTPAFTGPNFLTSCGWKEDAPPVTLSYPVPNGRYYVAVELGRHQTLNDRPSSLLVRAEADSAFAPVRFVTGDQPWWYDYGGTWRVDDGSFDIELEEGNHEDWATMRRVRMHPAETAPYSFPIDALFERRRGGGGLALAPPDAYVVQDDAGEEPVDDAPGLWRVRRSATPPYATLAAPTAADGPPLTLAVEAPNGRYGIDLEVESYPDSAELRYRIRGDDAFRTFTAENGEAGVQFLRGSVATVEDGRFELTLEARGAGEGFAVLGLHLVPVSEAGQPLAAGVLPHRDVHPPDPESDDAAETVSREALETIGYVH